MKIHELPGEVVIKIAAGEVVTGSFSIVKELIENSIDAGSTSTTIEIKGGGREYIMIKDNGHGMDSEELEVAIMPHTTSKIGKIEDLDNLETFGFRGEALSTIASVSRMKLSSIADDNETGTSLEIAGGKVIGKKPIAGNRGTTIEVYDLLYNTPARRKFLKSPASEGRMVTETIQRFLLAFPGLGLKFVRDGKTIYEAKPDQTLEERVLLMNPELRTEELIKVDETNNGIRVRGLVTLPSRTRRNRTGEAIFVNSRYVKQSELNYAVERGYGESLEKGSFPFAALFIETNPSEIDVNIHPQKLEVKFSNSSIIFESIKRAVRSAIRSAGSFVIRVEKHTEPVSSEYLAPEREAEVTRPVDQNRLYENAYREPSTVPKTGVSQRPMNIDFERTMVRKLASETAFIENGKEIINFIGIFGERYILLESDRGLEIVDQHAAHERIIYEDLKNGGKEIHSQNLLLPIEISVTADDLTLFSNKISTYDGLGFKGHIESDKIKLTAIPSVINEGKAKEVFNEILDELRLEGLEDANKIFDNILASIACKAAVKTGDKLDETQAVDLIRELKERKLLVCPHGRPISMTVRYKDLDRYFSR